MTVLPGPSSLTLRIEWRSQTHSGGLGGTDKPRPGSSGLCARVCVHNQGRGCRLQAYRRTCASLILTPDFP